RDLDVAGHHEALVQDPVEHLDQPGGASVTFDNSGHKPGILPHGLRKASPPATGSADPCRRPFTEPSGTAPARRRDISNNCGALGGEESSSPARRGRGGAGPGGCKDSTAGWWAIVFLLMGNRLPMFASASPARCPVL